MTDTVAPTRIVLGTRGSPLALWQARNVADALCKTHPGIEIEERILRTEGDIRQDVPLTGDDVGFFVREIERALLDGDIDLAVHSLKDLPTEQPPGLMIGAVPPRYDPRDALLSPGGNTLDTLPEGARVATGSPRRRTQLLHARPDLRIVPVRGNIDTRIRKLLEGEFDALVLAVAGIERLGLTDVPYRPIDCEVCIPAVGQAALAIEVRRDDRPLRDCVADLEDATTRCAIDAERTFLARLGGGCLAPATAHAQVVRERIRIDAVVGDLAGRQLQREHGEAPREEGNALGAELAERLLAAGAGELLRRARDAG